MFPAHGLLAGEFLEDSDTHSEYTDHGTRCMEFSGWTMKSMFLSSLTSSFPSSSLELSKTMALKLLFSLKKKKNLLLFIYLHWVLVVAHKSLIHHMGSSFAARGLSSCVLWALEHAGSIVVLELSCPVTCRVLVP